MKTVRNSLALLAASLVVAGAAQTNDAPTLIYRDVFTNAAINITLDLKTEPQLVLESGAKLTGLFVDCLAPQQTWNMLNPNVPTRNLLSPVPPQLLPVKLPRPINDRVVHEPNFAVLRLSFP